MRTERTILVVADNPDSAESTAMLLAANGRPAIFATTVEQAVEILDQHPDISLVVSDIRMPFVDGFDLLRLIKYRFAALPVILMTGGLIGRDDVVPPNATILQKPIASGQLLATVASMLEPSYAIPK